MKVVRKCACVGRAERSNRCEGSGALESWSLRACKELPVVETQEAGRGNGEGRSWRITEAHRVKMLSCHAEEATWGRTGSDEPLEGMKQKRT